MERSEPQRLPALDGFRGIAILAVLVVHGACVIDEQSPAQKFFAAHVMHLGVFGVDLFFVLSGFLITGILLSTAHLPGYFRIFYARRFLRLFPVYYFYLLVVAFLLPLLHRAIHSSLADYNGSWWWYLAYLSNWKSNHGIGDPSLGHIWSLAVEEQFYLFWPAVVLLAGERRLARVCMVMIAAAITLRMTAQYTGHGLFAYTNTLARLDELALGGLLALAVRKPAWRAWCVHNSRRVLQGSAAAGVLTIIGGLLARKPEWVFGAPACYVFALGSAAIVFQAATASHGVIFRIGTNPMLMRFGKYSYALYVLHPAFYDHMDLLQRWLIKHLPVFATLGMRAAWLLLLIAGAFGCAAVSWMVMEEPLLRLKKKFPYPRKAVALAG